MYQYNPKLQSVSLPLPSQVLELERSQLPSLNQVALHTSTSDVGIYSRHRDEMWSTSILQDLSNAY